MAEGRWPGKRCPGAYAYSMQSNGNKSVTVQDKFENGQAVYGEFDRKNTRGLRLWNTKDIYNSKTTSDSYTSNYAVKVTACEQVNTNLTSAVRTTGRATAADATLRAEVTGFGPRRATATSPRPAPGPT